MTHGARARIRLGAIQHNFRLIKSKAPGCQALAVIKGNAYGHGMLAAAGALADADAFGVARLSEARTLREGGIEKPLVLLGGVGTQTELDEAVLLDTSLSVHSNAQIILLENHAGREVATWLKIDTGMNRLGIPAGDAPDAIARLQNCAAVSDLKIMTHFANADDPGDPSTQLQIEKFLRVIDGFPGEVSIANSAGLFGSIQLLHKLHEMRGHDRVWIRPGIALYGVSPIRGKSASELGLRAAMQFEATLCAVKPISAGQKVGYGGTWRTDRDTMLGIVAAGYGDGYTRFIPSGTPVMVNGRRVPVVGVVSMDLTAVDLGPGATDRAGDSAILWGDDDLPVEVVAEYAGTVPYQLVTGVTHREVPIYEDE
ncbi:MAG: alanine racemase [Proteobacteria bacterium]|nr:alanine racemase [Pseudomonadota bacterium]MDA0994007.1 alanine racemase [Pseudomonadota bacterium]